MSLLQCLIQLSHNLICSGGRDLCIWNRSGNLLDKFDRNQLQETSKGEREREGGGEGGGKKGRERLRE